MSPIRQIVYVSSAYPKLSAKQIEDLLVEVREKNEKADITGLLVYSDGSIMQAIEGPPEAVQEAMGKIKSDTRHKDVIVILDHETEGRDFPDWRMAYRHEPHPEPIRNCVELLRSRDSLMGELTHKRIVGSAMSAFIERAN